MWLYQNVLASETLNPEFNIVSFNLDSKFTESRGAGYPTEDEETSLEMPITHFVQSHPPSLQQLEPENKSQNSNLSVIQQALIPPTILTLCSSHGG